MSGKAVHGHCVGGRESTTYKTWQGMHDRCSNPNSNRFKDYGQRGIKVCLRWFDFQRFLEDMGHKPKGMTLERKCNNGHYTPENCAWATPLRQARNRRNNKPLTFKGETHCISEWAEITGIERHTIQQRLKRGWSTEQALTISPCGTHAKV